MPRAQDSAPWRDAPATCVLIAACLGWFALTFGVTLVRADDVSVAALGSLLQLEDTRTLGDLGGLEMRRVWQDAQWWRVVSTLFVHGSWLHVAVNVLSLWALGRWTERAWGPWRQLVVFGLGGVMGCVASLAVAEAAVVVGASGGVFALGSGLVVARRWGSVEIRARLAPIAHGRLAFWLVLWIGLGFAWPAFDGGPVLSQAGHIGGAVGGILLGLWAAAEHKWLKVLGLGCAIVLTLGAAWFGGAPDYRASYHAIVGFGALQEERPAEAAEAFERALALAPEDGGLANAVAYGLAEDGVSLDRAEELVSVALRDQPGNADFWDTRGWILCRRGSYTRGVVVLAFTRSLQDFPEVREHARDCRMAGPQ